eukprot:1143908-Pelagomonas_calceolata.AAC.2
MYGHLPHVTPAAACICPGSARSLAHQRACTSQDHLSTAICLTSLLPLPLSAGTLGLLGPSHIDPSQTHKILPVVGEYPSNPAKEAESADSTFAAAKKAEAFTNLRPHTLHIQLRLCIDLVHQSCVARGALMWCIDSVLPAVRRLLADVCRTHDVCLFQRAEQGAHLKLASFLGCRLD